MRPVRSLVALTALAVLLLPLSVRATAPVVALDAAALRAFPDSAGQTVAQTDVGRGLTLVGCLPDYSWCQATLGTQVGWVEGSQLGVQDGGQMYAMPAAAQRWQIPVVPVPAPTTVVYGGGVVGTEMDAARLAALRASRARAGTGPTESTDMTRGAPLDRSPPIPQDSLDAIGTTPATQTRQAPLDRSPPIPTGPASTPRLAPLRPLPGTVPASPAHDGR